MSEIPVSLEGSRISLIRGDALDEIKEFGTSSLDIILIDPPFEILERSGTDWNWDSWEFTKYLTEFQRILKPNRYLIIFNDFRILAQLHSISESYGFYFRMEHIWVKPSAPPPFHNQKKPSYKHEVIHVYANTPETKHLIFNRVFIDGKPYKKVQYPQESEYTLKQRNTFTTEAYQYESDGKYLVHSVIKAPSKSHMKHTERTNHPTQKPEHLIKTLLEMYSEENWIVLDCFAGSGTTPKVCFDTNRKCIAIEKESKYFTVMKDRVPINQRRLDSFLKGCEVK